MDTKKRKNRAFLKGAAVLTASLAGGAGSTSVIASVTVDDKSKTTAQPEFVITTAKVAGAMAFQHDSHASHASHDSHASHASHASHYSSAT